MLNYIFCFNRSITFPSDCFLPLVYLLKKRFLNFSTIPFICPPFRPSIYLFIFSPNLSFLNPSIRSSFLPYANPPTLYPSFCPSLLSLYTSIQATLHSQIYPPVHFPETVQNDVVCSAPFPYYWRR